MDKQRQDSVHTFEQELEDYIPQLSINCVIFRFNGSDLQIPVAKPSQMNKWCIPGGFVRQSESIDEAARRILYEQTQLKNLPLSQFGTFGSSNRRFLDEFSSFKELGFHDKLLQWLSQRFVTIGYYSVVGMDSQLTSSFYYFEEVQWVDISLAQDLALDHSVLVSEAQRVLRAELLSRPLLESFMPETFTLKELQNLYELILGRPVDRGNFRQRILKSGMLKEMGIKKDAPSRPPILYSLDPKKYRDSLSADVKLGF